MGNREQVGLEAESLDYKDFSPNSTWLVTSRHDTFDVSSPCILAVSSLSNSMARHSTRAQLARQARRARNNERDRRDSQLSCCV